MSSTVVCTLPGGILGDERDWVEVIVDRDAAQPYLHLFDAVFEAASRIDLAETAVERERERERFREITALLVAEAAALVQATQRGAGLAVAYMPEESAAHFRAGGAFVSIGQWEDTQH